MPDESDTPEALNLGLSGPFRGYVTARDQLRATLAHLVMAADWQAREAGKLAASPHSSPTERTYQQKCASSWRQLYDEGRYALGQVDGRPVDDRPTD